LEFALLGGGFQYNRKLDIIGTWGGGQINLINDTIMIYGSTIVLLICNGLQWFYIINENFQKYFDVYLNETLKLKIIA